MLRENRPVVVEGNGVDSKFEDKAEDEISEVCSEGNRLRVADRNEMRGRYSKAKEDGAKGQGSNGGSGRGYRAIGTRGRDNEAKEEGVEGEGSNGEKVEVELEKKVDHKALPRRGQNKGFGKAYRNGIRVKDNEVKDEWVEGEGSNGEKVEVELEKKVDHKVLARKGQNRGFGKRYRGNGIRGQDNEAKEEGLEGHGSTSELVEVELEKKVDHKVLPRNGENRGFGKSYRGNGIQGRDNEAKVEGVEGEGSTGELVEVELEKKVDHKILPRRGEYRGFPEAYRGNGIRGRNNKAKEEGVEGERSNGEVVEVELDKKVDQKILPIKGENKGFRRNRVNGIQGHDNKATEEGVVGEGSSGDTVEVEVEKKVEHKVVPRKGEYRGSGRTYRANGIHGRDNKATEDGFEGEISNADKESAVIVKPVYSKVLPRNGQNMSFGRGYLGNGNRRGGFGRGYLTDGNQGGGFGRGGKRVWVKKEEFDA